jgi:hypothetical protein
MSDPNTLYLSVLSLKKCLWPGDVGAWAQAEDMRRSQSGEGKI